MPSNKNYMKVLIKREAGGESGQEGGGGKSTKFLYKAVGHGTVVF